MRHQHPGLGRRQQAITPTALSTHPWHSAGPRIKCEVLEYQQHEQAHQGLNLCSPVNSVPEGHSLPCPRFSRLPSLFLRHSICPGLTKPLGIPPLLSCSLIFILAPLTSGSLTFPASTPSGPMTWSKICLATWESTADSGSSSKKMSASL